TPNLDETPLACVVRNGGRDRKRIAHHLLSVIFCNPTLGMTRLNTLFWFIPFLITTLLLSFVGLHSPVASIGQERRNGAAQQRQRSQRRGSPGFLQIHGRDLGLRREV